MGPALNEQERRVRVHAFVALIVGFTLPYLVPTIGVAQQSPACTQTKEDPPESIQPSLLPGLTAEREKLKQAGITYGLEYIGELLGNSTGGIRRGTTYGGRLEFWVRADLTKLGWECGGFGTNVYQIHGQGLSTQNIGNLMPVSNIEALSTTRLSEFWFEHRGLFHDKLSIRFGQLAVDNYFMISPAASAFTNGTFGWAAISASNLPSGGPAYPFAAPGLLVRFHPNKDLNLIAAIFNGDPAGPGDEDPQILNRHGLNFRMGDPPLTIGEVRYIYARNPEEIASGEVKLGGWYHFGRFADQRFGADGLSLAAPGSNGLLALLGGNYGVYGIIEQQIYYNKLTEDEKQIITVFGRVAASPSDRNLIDFYADAGILFEGLVPGRASDAFGFALAYGHMSDKARALDIDTVVFTGVPQPLRDYEIALEAFYKYQVIEGWEIRPTFQYIWHPGGNIPHPDGSGARIGDAAVFGVRTVVKY